jgi:predicted naringenin-chalcone synthase
LTVYVLRPAVVHPPHLVTTEDIRRDLHRAHPDFTRRALFDKLATTVGVDYRWFSDPLEVVAAPSSLPERTEAAWEHLRRHARQAARQTMAEHGIEPGDVDVLITSHATGDHKPGLDVALVNDLGLRPTVRRVPMTQLVCAGGAQALIHATTLLRAGLGRTALVVVAETLSTVYHHSDLSAESIVFKYLFGDSGAATIVTADRPADRPSLEVLDTYEMVLPGSDHYYRQRMEPDGFHFDSTKQAMTAAAEVMPQVVEWLRAGDPKWTADHVVAHPGGRKIIDSVAAVLQCPPHVLRHSTASMREGGNRGGAAVLDVLRRTMAADDLPEAPNGCVVSFGPGFVTAALRTRAHVPA